MGMITQSASTMATMQGAQMAAQGDILAGQAAAQAATFNAGVAQTNAQIYQQGAVFAGQAGEATAGVSEMKTRADVGAIKAQQGASGIDVNTGSAVDVRASAASTGMLDALTIRSNAAKQAYQFQTEAASSKAEAGLQASQAAFDIQGANLRSKATILGAQAEAGKSMGNYLLQNGLTSGMTNLFGGGEGEIAANGQGAAADAAWAAAEAG